MHSGASPLLPSPQRTWLPGLRMSFRRLNSTKPDSTMVEKSSAPADRQGWQRIRLRGEGQRSNEGGRRAAGTCHASAACAPHPTPSLPLCHPPPAHRSSRWGCGPGTRGRPRTTRARQRRHGAAAAASRWAGSSGGEHKQCSLHGLIWRSSANPTSRLPAEARCHVLLLHAPRSAGCPPRRSWPGGRGRSRRARSRTAARGRSPGPGGRSRGLRSGAASAAAGEQQACHCGRVVG